VQACGPDARRPAGRDKAAAAEAGAARRRRTGAAARAPPSSADGVMDGGLKWLSCNFFGAAARCADALLTTLAAAAMLRAPTPPEAER
jgi:hypothetical protein